jgi:hypothetical protein
VIVNDVGKVVMLFVVTAGALLLVGLQRAEWTQVDWIIAAVVAYTTGNGVLAARKQSPSPMIVPHLDADEVATPTGGVHTVGPLSITTAVDTGADGDDAWPDPDTSEAGQTFFEHYDERGSSHA